MAASKQSLDVTRTTQSYLDACTFYQVGSKLVLYHTIDAASTQVVSLPRTQGFYMKANQCNYCNATTHRQNVSGTLGIPQRPLQASIKDTRHQSRPEDRRLPTEDHPKEKDHV